MKAAIAAAALVLAAIAGCSTQVSPAAPHTAAPSAHRASASPAPAGLAARTLTAECAAQLEVGTAGGHDYSSAMPHSLSLPAPCRPLSLAQLTTAVRRAVRDMRSG